jgi:hypothetical protein
MECSEFKLKVGAEPQHLSAAAQEHMSACAACERYAKQMRRLDARLQQALLLPVTRAATPALRREIRSATQWLAWAASLLVTAGIATAAWLVLPSFTLASELIEHYSAEQDIVVAAQPLDVSELNSVLRQAGVQLNGSAEHPIWYAMSCPFRGRDVPHLIVQTAQGRVTVMLLSHEHVRSVQRFDEQGYRGTILPSGTGSIAIIATNQAAVEEAAKHVAAAVEWIN